MKKLSLILVITTLMISLFVMPANANVIDYMYGDVNMDNKVDVNDATDIRFYCAKLNDLEHISKALADFDDDKEITILDATKIQMYVAKSITHPREIEYLEYYVEIDDINIEPYYGDKLLEDKAIVFEIVFDDEYTAANDTKVCYDYKFRGITDPTYYREHLHDLISDPDVSWSFPEPGVYEIEAKVYRRLCEGEYTFTKRFEVLPKFEFDGLRFVDYKNYGYITEYFPQCPEDTTAIEFQSVVDGNAEELKSEYGYNSQSGHYVALVHTKEEYDGLFEIDNEKFTEEFFKDKSLVVTVSQGTEYYDYFLLIDVLTKDDVMYVRVSHSNNSPFPGQAAPTTPVWNSFAAVDKSDVEHIKTIQKVN